MLRSAHMCLSGHALGITMPKSKPLTVAKLLRMPTKDYMNPEQLAFFKCQLLARKQQASERIETMKQEIGGNQLREADELNRTLAEEDNGKRMGIAERDYYLMRNNDNATSELTMAAMATARPLARRMICSGYWLGQPQSSAPKNKHAKSNWSEFFPKRVINSNE